MNKKQTANQNAAVIIIVGILLASIGAYQIYNPVLSVEPHPDRPDLPPAQPRSMLATTTFEVTAGCPTPTVTFLDSPEITFEGTTAHCRVEIDAGAGQVLDVALMSVDGWNGANWVNLYTQLDYNTQTQIVDLTWEMVETTEYAHCLIFATNDCGMTYGWVSTAYYSYTISAGAQIDDATDTLVLAQQTYKPGDTVYMTASGQNIGDETWYGHVNFIVTKPDGSQFSDQSVTPTPVTAGGSRNVNNNFNLPSDAAPGTWNVQSIWTDDDGVVHAKASIDLDPVEIWGLEINVIGGLMVLLGLLGAVYGYTKLKQ